MNFIQIDRDFASDPKVLRFGRLAGLSLRDSMGLLVMLWTWALRHRPDGDLSGLDTVEVEMVCAWEGEDGKLVEALTRSGLLDAADNGDLSLHGWLERYESLRGVRHAATNRKRRAREQAGLPLDDAPVTRDKTNVTRDKTNVTRDKTNVTRDKQDVTPVSRVTSPVSHECHGDEVEGEVEVEGNKSSSPPTPPSREGGRDKRFSDRLLALWTEAHGGTVPSWKSARGPWVQISQLVAQYGEPEVERRWRAYLTEQGDFFRGHPVGKFASQFDRWAPQPEPLSEREALLAKRRSEAMTRAKSNWDAARYTTDPEGVRRQIAAELRERWKVEIPEADIVGGVWEGER